MLGELVREVERGGGCRDAGGRGTCRGVGWEDVGIGYRCYGLRQGPIDPREDWVMNV